MNKHILDTAEVTHEIVPKFSVMISPIKTSKFTFICYYNVDKQNTESCDHIFNLSK